MPVPSAQAPEILQLEILRRLDRCRGLATQNDGESLNQIDRINTAILIPARWASTRFPGKPLAMIAGTSLIERVWRRASRSSRASAVYVATDDQRIFDHVESFGGKAVWPKGDFATGSDRIAAALPLIEEREGRRFDVVVNVQGDEPLIDISSVDGLVERLIETGAEIGTLACPLETDEEFLARDVVKAVVDERNLALYFSRAPIGSREVALRHIGVYAYRREALEAFVRFAPAPLERAESLEQLRALHHGFRMAVLRTSKPHLGVDRPEDVARVEKELAEPA